VRALAHTIKKETPERDGAGAGILGIWISSNVLQHISDGKQVV
jgi:hypothetical protein